MMKGEKEPGASPLDDFYNLEKQEVFSFCGRVFKIVHCAGALESFYKALNSVDVKKAKSLTKQMKTQVEKLGDSGRLSTENFPDEGELPSKPGGTKRKFKALKRIPIRGYCWRSETHENTIFISHYINKRTQKLKQKDTKIIGNNWTRIEEGGDER